MAIGVTFAERWSGGSVRNAFALVDRHGDAVLSYAKVHTCDFGADAAYEPGDGFRVADLDTRIGPVKVGGMICYDREHPESARLLMLQGAELVLTPNACTLEKHRLEQFRTHAFENMMAMAMTNYAWPQYNGHSTLVTGIALDAEGRSLDTVVVEAGEEEGVVCGDIDIASLRRYRAREIWGNAYRKPHQYTAISEMAVVSPFIRADDRRDAAHVPPTTT